MYLELTDDMFLVIEDTIAGEVKPINALKETSGVIELGQRGEAIEAVLGAGIVKDNK
jgi:hypothetical protein